MIFEYRSRISALLCIQRMIFVVKDISVYGITTVYDTKKDYPFDINFDWKPLWPSFHLICLPIGFFFKIWRSASECFVISWCSTLLNRNSLPLTRSKKMLPTLLQIQCIRYYQQASSVTKFICQGVCASFFSSSLNVSWRRLQLHFMMWH